MKFEQTMQRSQKSVDGIIGQTQKSMSPSWKSSIINFANIKLI